MKHWPISVFLDSDPIDMGPDEAARFLEALRAAKGLITAPYNFSVPEHRRMFERSRDALLESWEQGDDDQD